MPKLYKRVTEWFALEDDPMGGRIEVAHLEPHEISLIVNRTTRTVNRVGLDNKPERVQEIDLELDRQETADLAVVNWENFFDADGAALPCTSENKRLWALDAWFARHLKEKREQLAARVAEERQAAEKN